MSTSWPRIVPSARAAVRYRSSIACRLGRASSDSCRDQTILTGRRVRHTASAR